MTLTIALAGDTMLGRGVAGHLDAFGPGSLFAPELKSVVDRADLFLLNLECCVSARGHRARIPGKPFFFRAPPSAAEALALLGVDVVTLANNHALDYGPEALDDTLSLLADAGIGTVGAGPDAARARAPLVLKAGGLRIGLLGIADHPEEFAAGPDTSGTAYADLHHGVPPWLTEAVRDLREDTDITLVTAHWGPNMAPRPVRDVERSAPALLDAGADLVIGHSAHVFQGFTRRVLFDLGDFIDDYAVDPRLRNDLGLLFLATLEGRSLRRVDAYPIALDYCHTRPAAPDEYAWIRSRLTRACAPFGTTVTDEGDRLTARWA
ncbi:CapA family protein [Streptomyces sp. NPDC058572]|uniref:CapA family protein n=1 Tax=Streptomyces sp. NPDC058572 TaxID=3346546 RepID=UPI003669EE55